MKSRTYRAFAVAAITSTALAASILAAGTATAASTTPPWEPDPSASGTIMFYDSSGNVITGGSTSTAPFAAYAVGSTTVRAGDTQAQMRAANPDPSTPTTSWFKDALGGFSSYPLTSGPANIQTMSQTEPVVVGTSSDETLDDFYNESTHYTGTGYTDMIQLRMVTANSTGAQGTGYDDADIMIDPSAHTFQIVYPAPAVTVTAPMSPTNVSAVAGNASATVSWTAPTDNGGSAITGYDVEYSDDGGVTYTSAAPAFNTSTATSGTVTGLTNGTPYVFRVAAINAVGMSAYSTASTSVTPTAPTVPAAPTGVSAVAGNAMATVSWTAPTDNGGRSIIGYDVQYSSDGGANFTSASMAFNSNTATTEKVTGLTNGTSYVFRVAAINSVGTSAYSASSTAVTPMVPPVDSTTLAISGPTAETYNAVATMAATLTDSTTRKALGSQTVSLYRRANSAHGFGLVGSAKTSSSGVARYAFHATANGQYEWRFAGSSTHKAATSAVRTLRVSQTVSIARTPATVKPGAIVKLFGTVGPAVSGQKLTVQQASGGKWHSVGTATLKKQKLPNGKTEVGYIFAVRLAKKGTYTYRVVKAATPTLGAVDSARITAKAS